MELLCIFAALIYHECQFIQNTFLKLIRMKKILLSVAMLCMALGGRAETQEVCQGWPADYGGVMLQGFWWDSYNETTWAKLTEAAPELSQYFDLIWVPNSGTVTSNPNASTQGPSMGYDPCFWLSHNSCFGTEAELRTMIQTYKSKGVGIIEDVVINHKKGQSSWLDFPDEEVIGSKRTYNIDWNDTPEKYITKNDDCNYQGYTTSGGYDTGDDFPGFRDLDHTSEVTRGNIKVYLDYLLNELGYAGFRYDLVKGYGAGYIQEYNNSAMPTYSVGEYWDNQTNIQNWIMGTGNTSAAFDFPLKYKINDAIGGGDYSAFDWKSFSFDPNFSRYAITFADNHDSGREDHSKLKYNWSAANAFLLASPGTPCIWYPHYLADPTNIQAMIVARKDCGITNTGCIVLQQYPVKNNSGYIFETQGSKGRIYLQLGSAVDDGAPAGYTLVAYGDAYKFYSTQAGFAYVTVSPDGGPFTDATLDVTLTPVQASTAWYRVGDGETTTFTEPTTVTIGNGVDLDGDITIYWGATGSSNTEYTGSKTFTKRDYYAEPSFGENEIGVFFETDANEVYFYAWGGDLAKDENWTWDNKPLMTRMGVNDDGKLVYKWTYNGTLEEMPTGLLFIPDSKQTSDMDFVNHGYYTASGLSYYLGTSTVYFDNSVSNWDHVYYYVWDNQGKCKTQWPGELISSTTTIDGHEYYKVDLDGKYTSIIFNDPEATGVKQTEDLTVVDGKVYKLGANTVYYDNSSTKWTNVYYYAYTKDEVPKAKWPGEKFAAPNANGLFETTLLDAYTTVIFNDGTGGQVGFTQTENLAIEDGTTYTIGANTVYFDNTGTGWEYVYCYAYNEDNPANVIKNADWPGVKIEPNADGLYEATLLEGYKLVIFNRGEGGDVGVAQTGNLEVVDGKIYTLSGGANTAEGYTVYFDNSVSNWNPVNVYLWGSNKPAKWPWPGVAVSETNDQGYYVVHIDDPSYDKIIFNNIVNDSGVKTNDMTVEDGRVYTSEGVTTALVLSDNEPFFNSETFRATSVTYTREMSYSWGTILMPFVLTSNDAVQYYKLTAVDNEVLTLDKMESVPAGEPAVFKLVNGPGTLEINATNVVVVPTADENKYGTDVASWYMNGTYQGKNGLASNASQNIYFVAQDKFWLAEAAITVKPFRAWFETTSSLSAAKMRIVVEGEAEGIRKIEEERDATEFVYDLMGRPSDSSRKGIVIKNGTIIFVK